jgi:hypothetical protein
MVMDRRAVIMVVPFELYAGCGSHEKTKTDAEEEADAEKRKRFGHVF